MNTTFIQITDTHIREPGRLAYRRLDTSTYLQRAVQSIVSRPLPPAAVVLTGDLTDFGRHEEYRHLENLLAPLTMPVYLLPGNHDSRQNLRQAFPRHSHLQDGEFIQYAVPIGPVTLIALDTLTENASKGSLCARRLQWLEQTLDQYRDRPVVLAMHHPPFKTGIGHMDWQNLVCGADELQTIVQRYSNIEHILCGHVHRPVSVRFGGTVASIAPSPAHQVCLDLSANGPSSWTLEPAAYRMFHWIEGQGLINHLAYVENFDGPYPFYDESGKLID